MWHDLLSLEKFFALLEKIDLGLRDAARDRECPWCGGPLHVSNFPRKVRGVSTSNSSFASRFGLCCGHCRKRILPLSVRFLGRRVYAGVAVFVASIIVIVDSVVPAAQAVGAARRTVRRWGRFFRTELPATAFWHALRGKLSPELDVGRMPASVVELLAGDTPADKMLHLLRLFAPLTSRSASALQMARDG